MQEYKKCPYCGEQILAVAKKCKYCREWLVENPRMSCGKETIDSSVSSMRPVAEKEQAESEPRVEQTGQDNTQTIRVYFKTHEPSFIKKLMQMYWMNPNGWLLDEFIYEEGMLTISTLKGNQIVAPVEELRIRVQSDNYERREVFIRHGKEKLHFKEIPGMLDDEEWELLFGILASFPDHGRTKAGIVVGVAQKILDVVKEFAG